MRGTLDLWSLVGWGIFGVLVVAALLDHYLFNPFQFGIAYYAIYVINHPSQDVDESQMRSTLLGFVVVVLVFMLAHKNYQENQLKAKVEKACASERAQSSDTAKLLCEFMQAQVQSASQGPFPVGD